MTKKTSTKTVLDARKKKDIVAILAVGCSHETAARYVGCSTRTIRSAIRKDSRFAAEIAKAEEQSEVYFVKRIQQAAAKDQYWRAAAWALERRLPQRYGSRGANTLTVEQVKSFLERVAELIIKEVSDATERENILKRIKSLIGNVTATSKSAEMTTDDDENKENDERR